MSTLRLYPEPSTDAINQQISFIGVLDVDAMSVLEKLYVLPPHCTVKLDFALLQRVNSMGLAQLLKLFDYSQKSAINISIINANRMIMVLFKMTGLTRFLADGHTDKPAVTVPTQPQQRVSVAPTPPAQTLLVSNKTTATMPHHDGKLKLWVNAQNNQQINGWYFFNTYLQRHIGHEIQMELVQDAINAKGEPIEQMDMVFTTPFMAANLMLFHKFQPIARPLNQTEEVTLLVRAAELRQNLADFNGTKIVTSAADNFVYLLGRFLLEEADTFGDYLFSGHDIKALHLLLRGAADLLFMSSDNYQALTHITKRMVRQIDQSDTGFAFYLFCLSPQLSLDPTLGHTLSSVLLKMRQDHQGQQVLKDLNFEDWTAPKLDEIRMMAMLFRRYTSTATPPAIVDQAHN